MPDEMRDDGHEPATKADMRGIISRLDGHDQRFDAHDKQFEGLTAELKQMEARLSEKVERHEEDIVMLKAVAGSRS